MPNNMKMRQLEGFVVAAETGSFTQGAMRLSMTPPAFTQLIKDLEGVVGMALFERTTRRVELTEAGKHLLISVRRPLEDLDHAYREMKDFANAKRGRVTFSILHSLAFGIGTEILAGLKISHPDLNVQMIEDQNEILIERVINREVDFGLGMYINEIESLSFEPLLQDELVAVIPAGHALTQKTVVSWSTLAKYPLILLTPKSSVRRLVEAALVVSDTPREKVHEVVSMVTAINLVAAGFGVSVLPEVSLHSLKTDGVMIRRIGSPVPRRKLGIIRRLNRPVSPGEEAVVAALRDASTRSLPSYP